MFTLLLSFAVVSLSNAQNTTCTPIASDDAVCGVFAPAQSLFFKNQAQTLVQTYSGLISLACPILGASKAYPALFCFGAIGPCNGANFTLPETDASGLPKNATSVGNFYSNSDFGVLSNLNKVGVKPPCYELCKESYDAVKTCTILSQSYGVNITKDNCAGLPLASTKTCISALSETAFSNATGSNTTQTTPVSKSGGEKMVISLTAFLIIALL